MRDCTAEEILKIVEMIVSDDFCEDLEFAVALGRKKRETDRGASERFTQIYRVVHSFLEDHSCYKGHGIWRKEAAKLRGKLEF